MFYLPVMGWHNRMPNKNAGKRRKYRKYLRGNVDETISLATLAARTLTSDIFDEVVFDRTFVSSIEARWSLDDFTPGSDIGPIMVGLAHSDYSQAEIEAFIENTGSWNEGNKISQEIARRKVKIVGIFGPAASANDVSRLKDGVSVRTVLKWILLEGQSIDLWAYNLGSNPVATTIPNVHCQGHVNLWPQ